MAASVDQVGIEEKSAGYSVGQIDRNESKESSGNVELDNDEGLTQKYMEKDQGGSDSSEVAKTGSPEQNSAEQSPSSVSTNGFLKNNTEQVSKKLQEFTFDLARYTDDSWYDHWKYGKVMHQMRLNDRSNQYISEEIACLIGIDRKAPVKLRSSSVLKLAFADGKTIQRVIWLLGLAALGEEFKKQINGNEVRHIAKAIGRNSLRYSIQNSERLVLADGSRYSVSKGKMDSTSRHLKRLVIFSGRDVIGTILGQNSVNVFKRVLLKIPYACSSGVNYDRKLEFNGSAEVFLSELMNSALDDSFEGVKQSSQSVLLAKSTEPESKVTNKAI